MSRPSSLLLMLTWRTCGFSVPAVLRSVDLPRKLHTKTNWLRPALSRPCSLRFDGTLPDNLREIAILATGRFWTAQYEWYAHAKIALEVGVDEKIVNAMAQRRRPSFTKSDEAAVYEFCTELHEKQNVSDENYAWVVEQLGEAGAVELIALCGYYTIISMTLNVAQTQLPDGEELPLRD